MTEPDGSHELVNRPLITFSVLDGGASAGSANWHAALRRLAHALGPPTAGPQDLSIQVGYVINGTMFRNDEAPRVRRYLPRSRVLQVDFGLPELTDADHFAYLCDSLNQCVAKAGDYRTSKGLDVGTLDRHRAEVTRIAAGVELAVAHVPAPTESEPAETDGMVKLYRADGATMRYWEAWEDGAVVVVHHGTLGTKGRSQRVPVPRGTTADAIIKGRAAEQRQLGFAEIPPEEHAVLEVVYPADLFDDGATDVMDLLDAAELELNESLGWTGLGRCINFDYSGELTLTADVVDAEQAAAVVRRAFDARPELAGYAIEVID